MFKLGMVSGQQLETIRKFAEASVESSLWKGLTRPQQDYVLEQLQNRSVLAHEVVKDWRAWDDAHRGGMSTHSPGSLVGTPTGKPGFVVRQSHGTMDVQTAQGRETHKESDIQPHKNLSDISAADAIALHRHAKQLRQSSNSREQSAGHHAALRLQQHSALRSQSRVAA